MPYIDKARRADIDPLLTSVLEAVQHMTDGEMNYVLTKLVMAHTTHGGEIAPRYADYEAAIGLVECVKLELYRKAVAIYEDAQAKKNGEVFV